MERQDLVQRSPRAQKPKASRINKQPVISEAQEKGLQFRMA